jgi:hypothetical protein
MSSVLNLSLITFLGIVYIFTYSQLVGNYLNKIAKPKNAALLIVYFSAIFSAGINLFHISEIAENAFLFFMDKKEVIKAILYSFGFVSGMWVFSFVFFLVSFLLVSMLTPRDEKSELAMGSIEMAGLHGSILIILSFVIAPALISIASQFIPYPDMPF